MEAVQGRPGFAWEGGECAAWGLPPAAAMLGRGHRGIYLPFSSLLAAWMAGIGWPVGQHLLWDAAGSSQDLTLELQQRHKPWLCCCCSGCSITSGQVVTAFAALSALSSPAAALQLLELAALPSSRCGEVVLPWECRSFLLGRSMCYPTGRTAWRGALGDSSVHPRPCQHRGSRGILDQKSL